MAKLTLATVSNLLGNPTSAANTLNTNSDLIEAALENTLSRNGTTPNQMISDFDMNHNDILNASTISADSLLVNGAPVTGDAGVWYVSSGIPSASLGTLKDMYLDSTSGNVYGPKTISGWGPVTANIKGPTGSAGPGSGDMLKASNLSDLVSIPTARLNLIVNTYASTRTILKALDTTKDLVCYLTETGREGTWVWKSGNFAAQVTADTLEGMFCKADAIATTSGAWVRVYDGSIQAAWFGAKGDNSTDNAAILNSAIGVCKVLGLLQLRVGPGVFRYSTTINISSSNFSFVGSGRGSTIMRRTFAAGQSFYIANGSPNSINNVYVGDFSIDTTVRSTSGSDFMVETGNGVTINNIQGSGGFNAIMFAGCFECRASNIYYVFGNTTYTTECGVILTISSYTGVYGGNIYIDDCSFSNPLWATGSGAQYGMQVIAVDGLFVTNSYFGYFGQSANYLFNTIAGVFIAGVKFTNCWFDHATGNGVTIDGGVSANFSDIEFIGCSMVGGPNAAYNLRQLDGNAQRVRIAGCNMQSVTGDCIRLNGNGSSNSITVTGCHLANFDVDNVAGGNGITVTAGNSIILTDNIIDGFSTGDNGIQLLGGSTFVVTGNIIRNIVNGITTSVGVNDYVIANNVVIANSGSKIIDAGGPTKSVTGNI